MYGNLGLDTYGRKASAWVNKTKEAWIADMLQVFGASELFDSTFTTHNSIKEDVLSWSNRCCAQPSVSTAGLLLLLVRFTCTNHTNLGRLCHVDARGQALTLLRSLFADLEFLTIHINMARSYHWNHPRPQTSELLSAQMVQLQVFGEYVEISDLIRQGTGPGKNACCSVLFQALDSLF